MSNRLTIVFWLGVLLLLPAGPMAAQDPASAPQEIALSSPDVSGGMALNLAFSQRHSVRSFTDREVELRQISQLLWAANGITRPQSGKRTAPSPIATYPASIYLVNRQGVYLFVPQSMKLNLIAAGDHRSRLSTQKPVQSAPVSLIVVSDIGKVKRVLDERLKGNPENEKLATLYCAFEAGGIAENVYLEATSLGLGTVFVAGIDKKEISVLLQLNGEIPQLAMPIGYEKPVQ
jgi:SagB-type dehydrogenase family enzyme